MKLRRTAFLRPAPRNKNDVDYKWYVTSCLTKKRFATREEAILFASGYRHYYVCYHCSFCGGYHLTTKFMSKRRDMISRSAFIVQDKEGNTVARNLTSTFKELLASRWRKLEKTEKERKWT